MAHLKGVAAEFYESSKLAKYAFEPYWLAKRLKAEGHYIVGCDWKRNEHMPVRRSGVLCSNVEFGGAHGALRRDWGLPDIPS